MCVCIVPLYGVWKYKYKMNFKAVSKCVIVCAHDNGSDRTRPTI